MKPIFLIASVCICYFGFAQSSKQNNKDSCVGSNQGEQEFCWTKKLFKDEYLKQDFDTYTGRVIKVSTHVYKYGNKYLTIRNSLSCYNILFEKGILYPGLVKGSFKLSDTPDSLMDKQNKFYKLFKGDTLFIDQLKELKLWETSNQIRRFRFWLYREGLVNPIVCFFELENKHAGSKSDMKTFLRNAKLTFFKEGWIVM